MLQAEEVSSAMQMLQECILVRDPFISSLRPDFNADVCHTNPRCGDLPKSGLQHPHSDAGGKHQPHVCRLPGFRNSAGHPVHSRHTPVLLLGHLEAEIPFGGGTLSILPMRGVQLLLLKTSFQDIVFMQACSFLFPYCL